MLCFPDGAHSHSIVNSFDWERTSSYQGWIQDLLKGVHTNGAPVNFQLTIFDLHTPRLFAALSAPLGCVYSLEVGFVLRVWLPS